MANRRGARGFNRVIYAPGPILPTAPISRPFNIVSLTGEVGYTKHVKRIRRIRARCSGVKADGMQRALAMAANSQSSFTDQDWNHP